MIRQVLDWPSPWLPTGPVDRSSITPTGEYPAKCCASYEPADVSRMAVSIHDDDCDEARREWESANCD